MSEEKEVTETKESLKIQQQFTQVCSQLGDLVFKMDQLKEIQIELSNKYKLALELEQKELPKQN